MKNVCKYQITPYICVTKANIMELKKLMDAFNQPDNTNGFIIGDKVRIKQELMDTSIKKLYADKVGEILTIGINGCIVMFDGKPVGGLKLVDLIKVH